MHEPDSIVDTAGVLRPQLDVFGDEPPPDGGRLAPPAREGLPPGFRMRADAHYVDQLEGRTSGTPVRLIDTQAIDQGAQHGDAVSQAFVESIKRHGVLQPLLVTSHGHRYRVIAGRRRLTAALAAGLRDVPCLVQHVDNEQADHLALASNLPATRPRPSAQPVPCGPGTGSATSELAGALAALAACAGLLSSESPLARTAAANLVSAEAARAMEMLTAIQVLRNELPFSRAPVTVASILDRVARTGTAEREIRGIRLVIDHGPCAPGECAATGDAQVIAGTLCSLVSVAASLVEALDTSRSGSEGPARVLSVAIGSSATPRESLTFSVSQQAVALPAAWLSRPFEIAWPIRMGAAALVRLQAARRVAHAHGGELEIEGSDNGTIFRFSLPPDVLTAPIPRQ